MRLVLRKFEGCPHRIFYHWCFRE